MLNELIFSYDNTDKQTDLLASEISKYEKRPLVIAIDGRSGAGKSTLAGSLADKLGAPVIAMDDFFLPKELRSEERRAEVGGNVHYERFIEEVIPFLDGKTAFEYGIFDCKKMDINGTKKIPASEFYIVEGSYSQHPKFGSYADIRIFCDISEQEQIKRIIKRNGATAAENFKNIWIPLEENYFRNAEIIQKCVFSVKFV